MSIPFSDRRTGASYEGRLYAHTQTDTAPKLIGGSGYFSRPADQLDPHLFLEGTEVMRVEVRNWVLGTLHAFWRKKMYANPASWSTVWIAGSGVTYQWAATRESSGAPGDLDTLIGVDFPTFFRDNLHYRGFSETEMAEHFNDQFRGELDPMTAHAVLPAGGVYEVTFYVNPGATDIRSINPYAAYDVTHGRWTVPPIQLPQDWGPHSFSQEWWQPIHDERQHAAEMVHAYRQALREARVHPELSPRWLNAMTKVHSIIKQGAALFDSVHDDRHKAFAPGGQGYGDFYNFRWQAHKRDGLVSAMLAMKRLDVAAHRDVDAERYGDNGILDAQHALDLAALATD